MSLHNAIKALYPDAATLRAEIATQGPLVEPARPARSSLEVQAKPREPL